jgi:hypothetical protein
MAVLNRFISRLGEKGLPFFKLLKASEKFVWSKEANAAFTQLKEFLTSPPVLTAPQKMTFFFSTLWPPIAWSP